MKTMDIDIETKNFELVIEFCNDTAGFVYLSGDIKGNLINMVVKNSCRAYEIREVGKGFVFTVWDISCDVKELCRIKTDHKRGKKAFIEFLKARHTEVWGTSVKFTPSIVRLSYENRPWER